MKIIGIDIGTTSICALEADGETGNIIKSLSYPNEAFIRGEKSFEKLQDPAVIMSTVERLLSSLDLSNAAAIGFSGQMHGILYVDKNGNAVSLLYTWQDERGAQLYTDGKSYAEALGCFPGYGLATDLYNEKNGLIPDEADTLCTVADYAAMRLCGETSPLVHITNAASLGCFDIEKSRFKCDNPRLPKVVSDFEIVGKFKGIPVCVAVGDNQASFIGSVKSSNAALINVGTGSQISRLTDNPNCKGVEIRPFDGKRYLAAGCSLCGGRAFAMVEKLFREAVKEAIGECESFYPVLDRLLSSKENTDLSADCRFCGTRDEPMLRGGLFGISESNFTVSDIALAVLVGMTKELYDMYALSGGGADEIVCSGNGVRKNPALQRVIRRIFNAEIKIPLYEEEAAYGAALSAGTACGMFSDIDAARERIRYTEA